MKPFSKQASESVRLGNRWLLLIPLIAAAIALGCHRSRDSQNIARDIGSIGYLLGTLQCNNDGSLIAYVQTTEKGIGVFLCEVSTGKTWKIHEETELQAFHRRFDAWPWCPDGSLLAYSCSAMWQSPTPGGQTISICNGATGVESASIDLGTNDVKALCWLTPSSFAYVNGYSQMRVLSRSPNGAWVETNSISTEVSPDCFTALTTNIVAWRNQKFIFALNLTSNKIEKLLSPENGQWLRRFSYSQESKQLLLEYTNNGSGDSLYRVTADHPTPGKASLLTSAPSAKMGMLLNQGNGCAFISSQSNYSTLVVESDLSSAPVKLFRFGNVVGFTASAKGDLLYIVANDQAAFSEEIWEYNVQAAKLRRVVPCTESPTHFARPVIPQHSQYLMSPRKAIDCYCYAPVDLKTEQQRKHAAVVAFTPYKLAAYDMAPICAQAMANLDSFVFLFDRHQWQSRSNEWGADMLNFSDHLALNPLIDQQKIYALSRSVESIYLRNVAMTNKIPWRGMILLNPVVLPDLAALSANGISPAILICAEDLPREEEQLQEYQKEGSKLGIKVEYIVQKGTPHDLTAKRSIRERAEKMNRFINETSD